MNLQLKKFNMKNMKDNSIVVMICRRGGGKSTLIADCLYHKKKLPLGVIISPTEESDPFFSQFCPKLFIHNEYSPELLANFIKRQKKVTKMKKKNPNIDNRAFLVLDDCMYNAKEWIKDKNMRYVYFNLRHNAGLAITALQDPMGLPPSFRGNIDFVFILREPYTSNRKKIYEHYASAFPTYDMFCAAMDQCTENYGCLVIDNTTKSNNLTDIVTWYKADVRDPKSFKVGSEVFWQHHYNNYDDDSESDDDDNFDISQYGRKKINLNVQKIE